MGLILYLRLVQVRLSSMMEHRAAFLFGAVAQAAGYGAIIYLMWVMVDKFEGIAGWTSFELVFLFGLNLFSYSFAGIFCLNSFYGLGELIRTGDFDTVLTKPCNTLLFVAFRQFNYGYFSHLTVAAVCIALAWAKLDVPVTALNLFFLVVVLASGALIHAAVFIMTGIPAFWLVRNERLAGMLLWDVGDFTRYPVSIYSKGVQIILTFVLPYAFVAFYPMQYFTGKNDFTIFHPVFQFLSPLVGLALCFVAYRLWLFGLSRYQSTGS